MSPLSFSLEISAGREGIYSVNVEPSTRPGLKWALRGDQSCLPHLQQWMAEFLAGQQPSVVLCLDLSALPSFTQLVLRELQEIPFGHTVSYGSLAEQLGSPRGARAVGNACGRNPMPILIPCHRVLAAQQKLGGFSIGLDLKRQLLGFEGVQLAR